jgi:uncharacterized membrane protein YeaQ/YmgE (transglycosylase-associated protein family)
MFALLWEALIGLIVGAVAKLIMPGKDPGGIFITMAIGIAGSIGATYLGQLIGWYKQGQSAGFIMSVVGAILILWIYRLIKGKATAWRAEFAVWRPVGISGSWTHDFTLTT